MMTNTSVFKWNTQVFFVRIAPKHANMACAHQDKQKHGNFVIL